MQNIKKIIKLFVFLTPFLLGTIGFAVIEGVPLNDALFFSVGFYTLNNTDAASNIFLELARWSAPFVTASGLIMAVAVLKQRAGNFLTYLRGGSIAVYGPEEDVQDILNQLERNGILIRDENKLPRAERYIFMGREEDNFRLWKRYAKQLEGKPVYLKCASMDEKASRGNVKLFFEEETAARLFWKRQSLYRAAKQKNFQLKIVFAEFGPLEQQLLIWGLQNNIFHPEQRITYHIFGDSEKFQAVYHELSQMEDMVLFHGEPWYEAIQIFQEADRIIVSDTTELLSNLLFAIPGKCIDVLAGSPEETLHYEEQERLNIFLWREEAGRLSNILEERLLTRAKHINLRYAHLYSGVAETHENLKAEWGKLNTFTKYSNISAADYHEVRLQMLEAWKQETGLQNPDADYMMRLAELEHIRWNRYHYLHNWRYGIPENGKNKDAVKRIHQDLRPFSELSAADKEKDVENIRVLLSLSF